jgi:ABC-type bacteriocin/lantibiotic exporter with double-glycine peptidase domain
VRADAASCVRSNTPTAGALQRIHDVIERIPAPAAGQSWSAAASPAASLAKPVIKGDIHFNNVTFAYASRSQAPVLRGFSLHIPAGKSIALVGASGGGKSTVAALLLRMYDVPGDGGGSIKVDGTDVKDIDAR